MIALFQESTACSKESCMALSLLFPIVKNPGRQKMSRLIKPLPWDSNYTCASQGRVGGMGDGIRGLGKCIQVQ
jgi:hypothetical protein